MSRQKIRLLRQLSESGILGPLSGRTLKLYLVLLVLAKRIGREHTTDLQTLRRALGCDLTRRQLLMIGAALERRDLAVLRPCRLLRNSCGVEERVCFRILNRKSGGADGAKKVRGRGASGR
jgi:hypothetical protein